MAGQLQSVVALHKTKVELVEAETRLGGIPDWMRELHEEHSGRQGEIDAVAEKRDAAEAARRAAEAELADAQERAKRYQSQISQVSTQREYTALLKEIDTVKSQMGDFEKQVLEAIDVHDQAETEISGLREEFRELDERYQAELAKWESEKPAVAVRVEQLKGELEEIRAALPRGTVMLFDRIYERHGSQAVTQVVKIEKIKPRSTNAMWHCAACSYNVRPQVVIEIRTSGALIQCDSCKRILYLEDENE